VSIRVPGRGIVRGGKKKIYKEGYYIVEYCFPKVTKMYKDKGMLYIEEGKKQYVYDQGRIEMLQIREHRRQGIQFV
jgi:hypothetical protein